MTKPKVVSQPWTKAEYTVLFDSAERLPWDKVAALLPGRTVAACKYQFFKGALGKRPRETVADLRTARERSEAADTARQARASAVDAPRSLTAAFFGDPLPGRSALDQRRDGGVPA